MDIIVWILIGGAVGWGSYRFLRFNEARGINVSLVIGAAGAFLGGKVLAPMFTTVAAADFSVPALFFAATAAVLFVVLGNLVYVRWGV